MDVIDMVTQGHCVCLCYEYLEFGGEDKMAVDSVFILHR